LLTDINEFSNFSAETIGLLSKLGEIKHLAGLHAKMFIADDTCLITSANLTNTAFARRYEIGIFLDRASSSEAISIFESWWRKSEAIAPKILKAFRKKPSKSSEENGGSKVLRVLWHLPDDPGEMNYWLKPVGVTGDPIAEDRVFDKIKERLHFSRQKPKSVKIDDILIVYGVGAKRILSVYRVISQPKFREGNKRWPWYVFGQNLTPRFGKRWAKYNIYAQALREEYLKKKPKGVITRVGGTTLGGLNFGNDKIGLDPEFAKYVIRRVTKLNRGN
jgi:hypothetical protein